ncbi:MAG: DUF4476 domain-containing protein [Ignavibacteriae bacterium]|nr:DUF4476 domain-containing protein [Ignavibacteriota bacterium]
MKKSFLILAILFISTGYSFCFSSLNLSIHDGRSFYILFDNVPYSTPAPEMSIEQITGEKHFIKVFSDNNSPALNNVIFSDYIYIPDGFIVFAVIDEYNKFLIYKKITFNHSFTGSHKCTCNCECCKNCTVCNPAKINENDECKYSVIREDNFNTLKNSITSKSFENTKKDIIITALDENYFSAAQIKELLNLLSFESTKLETAKYSYKKICDKQNFSVVYDAFQFESSVNALSEWLRNNR